MEAAAFTSASQLGIAGKFSSSSSSSAVSRSLRFLQNKPNSIDINFKASRSSIRASATGEEDSAMFSRMAEAVCTYIEQDCPFLGICLGMQLLFESSEENGPVKGLGFIPGVVGCFDSSKGIKVPHIEWNSLEITKASGILDEIGKRHVYFVHSYRATLVSGENKEWVSSTCNYGDSFIASVRRGTFTLRRVKVQTAKSMLGQWKGFDIDLIKQISDAVSILVIASSGAGAVEHISEVPIQSVKEHLLKTGVEVRM
nr:imidazole glycerol phosphate synthase hisHF, chloroplastic-like [Ipomoea trifida]